MEKVSITPEVKEALWSALTNLATAPIEERTLTGLALLLQSALLRTALAPYTLEGPFGQLLDAAEDDLDRKSTTSDLQSLMRHSYAVFCLKKQINNTSTNI